jgi:hypothetical protein
MARTHSEKGHEGSIVVRFTANQPRSLLAVAALLAALAAQPAQAQNAKNSDITVLIDEATLVKLERPAAEIVVGNPSIADVSVQSGKLLVVTGKSYGETNLIVLDGDGKTVVNRKLIVQDPRTGAVTLYRGSARYTLSCAPYCTTPLVIGDEKDYFEVIAKQIRTKQGIGQTSAEGSKQSE